MGLLHSRYQTQSLSEICGMFPIQLNRIKSKTKTVEKAYVQNGILKAENDDEV